jgi:iron(III) transport system substrate-binding protein
MNYQARGRAVLAVESLEDGMSNESRPRIATQLLRGLLIAFLLVAVFVCFFLVPGSRPGAAKFHKRVVIVYCAQDQTYAEPLMKQFEQETGIKVKAVYDSEAVKTVGLANRLLAERSHPQCDIFWGNEELRTRLLAAQSVFREANGWAAFGYRSRRIVVNTNLVSFAKPTPNPSKEGSSGTALAGGSSPLGRGQGWIAPSSLLDLTNSIYRGKVALAYPQFGTTGTHMNALRQLWGESNWLAWCRALVANDAKLVDGNSVVVKLVGRGEAAIGLTDSDDILAGQREGLPVAMLPVGQTFLSAGAGDLPAARTNTGLESPVNRQARKPALQSEMLLIPNTVAVIRNAPHPAAAQKLFDWLQQPAVAQRLVEANALESPDNPAAGFGPDWPALLRDLDATTKQLNEVFLK